MSLVGTLEATVRLDGKISVKFVPLTQTPSGITTAFCHAPRALTGAIRPEDGNMFFVRPHACPRCAGLEYIWQGEDTEDCPVCGGKGAA